MSMQTEWMGEPPAALGSYRVLCRALYFTPYTDAVLKREENRHKKREIITIVLMWSFCSPAPGAGVYVLNTPLPLHTTVRRKHRMTIAGHQTASRTLKLC